MNRNCNSKWLLVSALLLSAGCTSLDQQGKAVSRHWGAGIYMTNDAGTLYDHARWDWMIVRFTGDPDDARQKMAQVNRFLTVNPNQKYLIRLEPHVDTPNHAALNFLHYRYDAEVRRQVQAQLREQIRIVQDNIAKPGNVVGYTFMEELPGNWGFEGVRLASAAQMPPQVEYYRKQIEAERGERLIWDEATWRWVGRAFEESLDEPHALIKQESHSAPILFWSVTGYASLDHADGPVDFQKRQPNVVAFSYKNIIKPGRCDGLVGHPANEEIWARYLQVARDFNCILVSQLSHGGYMRLRSWEQTLAMVKQSAPQNFGYFFFCEPQGKPSPLDKPDAPATLREFRDRLVQDATFPERGHVLKVTHPGDDRPFMRQAASYLYCLDHPNHGSKGLSVQPGQTLHWSVLVKAEDIQGKEGAVLTLVWDKSRGGNEQPTVLTVTGTHDWQAYHGTAIVPSDTVGGRVYLGMRSATGTAYFDDLRITVEGSDQNLVANSSFEEVETAPLHWKGWIIDDHAEVLAHWRAFCGQEHIGQRVKH